MNNEKRGKIAEDFSNIKVGNLLYICEAVTYGWNKNKIFMIKRPVERTTPTQFIVNGARYRKENGVEVGGWNRARLEGEDESNDMNDFKLTIKMYYKSRDMADNIRNNLSVETKGIDKVFILLEKVNNIINKEK